MFVDRGDAGTLLAAAVVRAGVGRAGRGSVRPGRGRAGRAGDAPVVLGLARGGVVVGLPVARLLRAPLEVLVVRKLGHPRRPELGLGALAEGGVRVLNHGLIAHTGVSPAELDEITARELDEIARRVRRYRGDRPVPPLTGREVVIVDDGVATGYTVRAAVEAAHQGGAGRVVVAVPVCPADPLGLIAEHADGVVSLHVPVSLHAVSEAYDRFDEVSDEEVVTALAQARG